MSDDISARPDEGATQPAPQAPATEAAPPPVDPSSEEGLLQSLAAALPPELLDEIWIFPRRRVGPGESTVIVASALEEPPATPGDAEAPAGGDEPGESGVASDRRRIFTARFTISRPRKGPPQVERDLTEHGAAPAERVARVVDGVIRRLEDEPAPPRHVRVGGDPARWQKLLAGGTPEELA